MIARGRIEIPPGQYAPWDPALRWHGQAVEVVRVFSRHVAIYSPSLACSTVLPRRWLRADDATRTVRVWISGIAGEHGAESGAVQILASRKRGKGTQIQIAASRATAEWFQREADFWLAPGVDPGSRYRGQSCGIAAARILGALES